MVRLVLLATGLASFGSCDNDAKITVYQIPKETQPGETAKQVALGSAAPANVHWTAPSNWEEQPATGFRKASFLIRGADRKQADVSVISFPETAGGLLANVNRWRNQLKLPAITDAAEAGAPLTLGGHDIFFVDLVSEQPLLEGGLKSRILCRILAPKGETWLFKMSGE